MIMVLDVDVTAERRHYNTHRPLKGKRLTTFCASLALLQNVFAVHRKGDTTTLGPTARQTYEPSGQGPVNPKNLSLHNPSTQPAAPAAPLFLKSAAKPPQQPSA